VKISFKFPIEGGPPITEQSFDASRKDLVFIVCSFHLLGVEKALVLPRERHIKARAPLLICMVFIIIDISEGQMNTGRVIQKKFCASCCLDSELTWDW
jgi:hypothetical protein